MRRFYGILCVLGTILPYGAFVPWLTTHGLAPLLLIEQAFASPVSAFAWLDVIVSAVVLIAFIWAEGRRLAMRRLWLPTLATLTVGVSLALPLFLLMRESAIAPLSPAATPTP